MRERRQEQDSTYGNGWRRRWSSLLLWISAAFFVGMAVLATVSDNGFLEWLSLRARYAQLEQFIQHTEEQNARLAEEIHALKTNYASIERYAREELGWVKDGETVYLLPHGERNESAVR